MNDKRYVELLVTGWYLPAHFKTDFYIESILSSEWLRKHDAAIRAEAIKDVWAGIDSAYAAEIGAR